MYRGCYTGYHCSLLVMQVKSIIFLTFWQMMMVDFVPGMSPEEASRWNDFIVCVEMLGFAALNNRAFSYKGTESGLCDSCL